MKKRKIDFTKPLKIYLIADNFRPCYDGMTKTTHTLALGLYKDGYDVTVICPFKKGYLDDVPYKVMRVPSYLSKNEYPLSKRHFSSQNKAQLDYNGPIIFHAQSPFVLTHLAKRYAKKHGIPFIATTHTKYKDDYLGITKSKIITKIMMNYTVKFFNTSDYIFAVSPSAAHVLHEYGVKKDITTIVTGTEVKMPINKEKTVAIIKNKYSLSDSDNIILFVGHLTWQKGIKLVLDSVKKSEDKYSLKFVVFFVGDGNRKDEILKYSNSLHFKSRIIFTGKINDPEEFKCMFLVANIFYFPSYFDTLGLVIHEAACLSLPSLLIKDSDCACFTTDNQNGYLADGNIDSMADKLHDIFTHKADISRVGQNARDTIPQKIDDTIKKTEAEYDRIIKSYYCNDNKNGETK